MARSVFADDFDLVGPTAADTVMAFQGYVGKTRVFEYTRGRIKVLDPRIRIAGASVGVGSTIADFERSLGEAPKCTTYDAALKQPDRCSTIMPRVDLVLDGARGRLALAKRKIVAIVWTAEP